MRRDKRAAIRAVLVVALVVQGAVAVRATAQQRVFRQGKEAYRARDVKTALDSFRRLGYEGVRGDNMGAWQGDAAAAIYLSGPATAEARAAALEAAWAGYASDVLHYPASSWSWSGLAEVALGRARQGEVDRAVDLDELNARAQGVLDPWRAVALGAARLATRLKPGGYQELDTLASVYASIGDVDRAMSTYEQSAQLMPSPSFHLWGRSAVASQPLYGALRRGLERGLEDAPRYERSALELDTGRFVEMNGDREGAIRLFRASRDHASNSYERFYGDYEAARVLLNLGRVDEALPLIAEAQKTGWGPAALRRLRATAFIRQEQFDAACAELQLVLRDAPSSAVRLEAALACERDKDIEIAERLLRDGFVAPSDDPDVAKALLDFYLRQGRRETAKNLIAMWMRDYPDFEPLRSWAQPLALQP